MTCHGIFFSNPVEVFSIGTCGLHSNRAASRPKHPAKLENSPSTNMQQQFAVFLSQDGLKYFAYFSEHRFKKKIKVCFLNKNYGCANVADSGTDCSRELKNFYNAIPGLM